MADVNFQELEYISNHLEPYECETLLFSLRSDRDDWQSLWDSNFTLGFNINDCFRGLYRWISIADDPTVLSARLMQIGRKDLGNWLTEKIFDDVALSIQNSVIDPFKDERVLNITTQQEKKSNITDLDFTIHKHDWKPIDTVLIVFIFLATISLLYAIFRLLRTLFPKRRKNNYTLLTESTFK